MNKPFFAITAFILLSGCEPPTSHTLITLADARKHPAKLTDIGEAGDSAGDIVTFDQPLLDKNRQAIGNNSGFCIRTQPGLSFQCQWTLTLDKGSIQVAGKELDQGTSYLSIVGGTGIYARISGEMQSTNNKDGTFTQTLHYRAP